MNGSRVLELSDDMPDLAAGGAGQTPGSVGEIRQRLTDMAERHEAARDGSGKAKEKPEKRYRTLSYSK